MEIDLAPLYLKSMPSKSVGSGYVVGPDALWILSSFRSFSMIAMSSDSNIGHIMIFGLLLVGLADFL